MASFSKEFIILGQKVVIRDEAEAELASVALQIVNQKVEEILTARPMLGPNQTAVLALLEIAGSLVKDRKSIDEYRTELDQKCSLLMAELARYPESSLERPNA